MLYDQHKSSRNHSGWWRNRVCTITVSLLSPLLLLGCGNRADSNAGAGTEPENPADVIFVNGDIVTVNDAQPSAQALAVRDGLIVHLGDEASARALVGDDTRVVDLDGRALLPGFMDAHSHFINALDVGNQANCSAPPFGPGDTKEGIIDALRALQLERAIPPGEVIVGYGYDDSIFPDSAKLTAADLDAAFPDHPVVVGHISLHGAVANSAMLAKAGITAETQTPAGGVIVRKPGTNEPEGLVMETAFEPIFELTPRVSGEDAMRAMAQAQRIYAAAGITTAQEGASMKHHVDILSEAAESGLLAIDVVAFPFIGDVNKVIADHPIDTWGSYNNRFKLGGVKITIDGSPQGRTAWFTTPYLAGGPGGEADWRGEPTFPMGMFNDFVQSVYDQGLPLLVHCNGDAAIDAFLDAHAAALADDASSDHRTSIIHCQFVRPDQLDRIADYNIIPSFYTEHTYFFGTTHTANRGPEQAAFISPLRSALDRGIRFGNHTDFNVAPIDQLFVMWTAVNRMTREGEVLGPDERISALDALKAITINVAYWYREEDRKGTLETGKLADLVMLSDNPLTVDPMTIKDITVLETFKEGVSVYRTEPLPG